jgi:5,5'-dehydrodivanillate O-demethylase
VPIDDSHTYHWWYSCHLPGRGVELEPQTDATIPFYEVPVPTLDAKGELPWPLLDNNSGQDMAMWYTQGEVADRREEHLGNSDKGVALYRKLLERELLKVQHGQDPMNVFRDPSTNVYHELHTETGLFNRGDPTRVSRAGQASKYSPILKDAAVRVDGEKALLEPVR